MKDLHARFKLLIYNNDYEIIYENNVVFRGTEDMDKIFDMFKDDYYVTCEEQDSIWTSSNTMTMEEVLKKLPTPDPNVDQDQWYKNIKNKEDFKKKC
jgi:hypothetical protein